MMSRFNGTTPRTIFASKTTFDALEVDFGEDIESEEESFSEVARDAVQEGYATQSSLQYRDLTLP